MIEIDWYKELEIRISGIGISKFTDDELYSYAGSWVTCACGNLCTKIPRDKDSRLPNDGVLRDLGFDFDDYIGEYNWQEAKITLDIIEKRSIELLNQME